jgi:hypothetical protein
LTVIDWNEPKTKEIKAGFKEHSKTYDRIPPQKKFGHSLVYDFPSNGEMDRQSPSRSRCKPLAQCYLISISTGYGDDYLIDRATKLHENQEKTQKLFNIFIKGP